ncbi:hypothetical protein EV715DRAFT_289915 [Schizophyllum commune]
MSTNDDQVYRPLGSDVLYQVRFVATRVVVEFVLYGVQITLSAAAIAILARRHGRSRFTMVAIFGLLLSSTIYTVANVVFYLVQFPVAIGTSERDIEAVMYRLDILFAVSKNFNVVECTVFFVAYADGYLGGYIINNISDYIAGIYPTCVLFAAAGGKTDSLLSAQVSQAMRFGDPPAAHERVREADTTIDFHLEDENSVGALNDGLQDLDSRADNFAGPSGTRSGESRVASNEGIIEVGRETTVM